MIEKMDSQEEMDFHEWLLDAERAGLVRYIKYHPWPFGLSEKVSTMVEKKLKTKTSLVEKFLLHPHEYTPDFSFEWDPVVKLFFTNRILTWVDVKGGFGRHGDAKQFSINQKWVYQKHGIYINKVVPEKLFLKTWVPEACRYTPKKRDLIKKYANALTLNEYLNKIEGK